MDSIEAMHLFIQVVRSGSFSEAARQLDLAPSSVTRRINQLEETLGARLLNRSTRKLTLTQAGHVYFDATTRILRDVDEARRLVVELEGVPRGILRLTAPISFGRLHIAPLLQEYTSQYPEVQVDLTLSDEFEDLFADQLDLAIRIGALKESSLIARRLLPMHRVVAAAPKYIEQHGVPNAPSDLKDHNCLVFRFNSKSAKWQPAANIWSFAGSQGVEEVAISGTMQSDNADALVAAAVSGAGIILMPDWLIFGELESGVLQALLVDHKPRADEVDRAVYLVYPSNRFVSPKVRTFIDFLVDKFSSCKDASAVAMI